MPRHYAIVPAAGSGARFGSEVPKQYLELAGKPLIHHALAVLCRYERIERVWVILSPGDAWWETYDWTELGTKLQAHFCGGITRAETVSNGLAAAAGILTDEDWVLVHDAARPCLSQDMLAVLCDELADDPVGGLLAIPLADTLKRADAQQRVAATELRDGLWQAQTPQMFRYRVLHEALAGNFALTDEASAIEAAGFKPRLVRADATNLKVTFPADLRLAELILQGRSE
ncbi:2-C-methyl-D-erythritol 4-phosphate cytidylyltransferase [Propionivibrio sp.]|uniref:2-C-methyl-D-erythritol 4-phosphate cytidylyltransferase n=1 Tax=Propionivibrio sp. TaxID=2212460 RepID=UPI00261B5809|nr:2-C-methyl-D-erythritol 4-phosphate cytidylyltransferase [Propionivibrio sp.]